MKKKFYLVAATLFSFASAFALSELPQRVQIGKAIATLEIADEEAEIVQGLSDRIELAPDHGMLFCFPDATARSFWMYHCYFDIDLAYVSADGTIRQILTMTAVPYNTPPSAIPPYPSKHSDIQYVIEMEPGWFAKNHVKVGDKADVKKYKSKVKDSTFR